LHPPQSVSEFVAIASASIWVNSWIHSLGCLTSWKNQLTWIWVYSCISFTQNVIM